MKHYLFVLSLSLSLVGAAPAMAQTPPTGAALFTACKACHSIDKSGKNGLGPSLNGVIGRKAGMMPAFNYSVAMKAYNKVWTPALLDAYLADPRKAVPGNRMIYPGLKDPAKRATLIAWIAAQ